MRVPRAWSKLAGVGLLLGGCAGPNLVFQKGQMWPGEYLSTVIVSPRIAVACQYPGSLGCARIIPLGALETGQMVNGAFVTVVMDRLVPARTYEIEAHELCHVVAGLQNVEAIPSPCHREDGGVIHEP